MDTMEKSNGTSSGNMIDAAKRTINAMCLLWCRNPRIAEAVRQAAEGKLCDIWAFKLANLDAAQDSALEFWRKVTEPGPEDYFGTSSIGTGGGCEQVTLYVSPNGYDHAVNLEVNARCSALYKVVPSAPSPAPVVASSPAGSSSKQDATSPEKWKPDEILVSYARSIILNLTSLTEVLPSHIGSAEATLSDVWAKQYVLIAQNNMECCARDFWKKVTDPLDPSIMRLTWESHGLDYTNISVYVRFSDKRRQLVLTCNARNSAAFKETKLQPAPEEAVKDKSVVSTSSNCPMCAKPTLNVSKKLQTSANWTKDSWEYDYMPNAWEWLCTSCKFSGKFVCGSGTENEQRLEKWLGLRGAESKKHEVDVARLKKRLVYLTGISGSLYTLAGPRSASLRQELMTRIMGVTPPVSECGIHSLMDALYSLAGIKPEAGCEARREDMLDDWIRKWD